MKKSWLSLGLLASTIVLSSTASATFLGPYIGASVGRGQVETPNAAPFNVTTVAPAGSNSVTRNGWAERGFVGYNVDKFFGLEVGYTNYARSLYNGRTSYGYSQMQYNFRTYDAVGKAYLPLGDTGYNLYVLLGAARVIETLNYNNAGVPLSGSIAAPANGTSHAYSTRPMYGVGINFSMYGHFTINVEVTQITRIDNFTTNANAIPYLNMESVGFAYNFC